ncbi:sensor histidine kinase [Neogemmobacter tilapiae]|uniref:C4-dicarboxylate transport sensor protein DctB n=1 Tax=Neogemmobacter tilapiae TaxID=875041 RepID=A0A918TJQ3_9RHOB|nr:ATP-binding protein [Gemmobacter tilapiae]GHC51037.1 two-component sensor histidine kinase [Gemmobacter tilapiae]
MRKGAIAFGIALICLMLAIAVDRMAWRAALSEGQTRAEGLLHQTVTGLEGQLNRFQALPALLARQDDIRALLSAPDATAIGRMNQWLSETNAILGASDLYLMDANGTTLSASNHDRSDSFVGQNFAYRPYFFQAMAGGEGWFFALGTTSGVRGYYFSAAVLDDQGQRIGVVALKIGVDQIEQGWRGGDIRVMVSDPQGIIFMSTEPGWLYKGLLPLTPDRLARSDASRRYSDQPLTELPFLNTREAGYQLFKPLPPAGSGEYLELRRDMPAAGWTVHVLLDTAPMHLQARVVLLAFLMFLAVALSLAWAWRQRRARLAERIALQAAAQAELEGQVAARTADLTAANAELHRMQADLVQAGKLAALGRISAALSHEINQPLAAARNYADSATLLIERGDFARAGENIGQILSLIDRMATIARHLRNVARKPETLRPVSLTEAVEEARLIADSRLAPSGAMLVVWLPADLPQVMAGSVRLQQVIVNLLTNAADAVEGTSKPRIEVTATASASEVILSIRDHGPGVSPAIADRIFDPFFTTKTVGSGLGLGLSISYNIMQDFGGDLRVVNHPEGGAVFTLHFRPAPVQESLAAE